MATVEEVLRILAEWGSDEHNMACSETCKHDRARSALVEVNNAVAEVEKRMLANRQLVLEAFRRALGTSYPARWVDGRTSMGDFSGRDEAVDIFNVPVEMQRELLRRLREARAQAKGLVGSECLFLFHTPEATEEHYKELVAELTKS